MSILEHLENLGVFGLFTENNDPIHVTLCHLYLDLRHFLTVMWDLFLNDLTAAKASAGSKRPRPMACTISVAGCNLSHFFFTLHGI